MTHSLPRVHSSICFFFFNDTATTEIYTLSLHDALPILLPPLSAASVPLCTNATSTPLPGSASSCTLLTRSEEHTSELQSQFHLVCRLLLEKKKKINKKHKSNLYSILTHNSL